MKKEENPKKIFVCSPYSGDVELNVRRAREIARQIALEGDIPIAPHLYFTSFLDDNVLSERNLGIRYALALLGECDEMRVYGEKISSGMKIEIDRWLSLGREPIYLG